MGADGAGSVGAVNAIDSAPEVHRASTERVSGTARHIARQIGLARDHLGRRYPIGPFRLPGDRLHARPGKTVAADADAVAPRLSMTQHQIEVGVGGVDNDGAWRFAGSVVNDLALQASRQLSDGAILRGPDLQPRAGLYRRGYNERRRRQRTRAGRVSKVGL